MNAPPLTTRPFPVHDISERQVATGPIPQFASFLSMRSLHVRATKNRALKDVVHAAVCMLAKRQQGPPPDLADQQCE